MAKKSANTDKKRLGAVYTEDLVPQLQKDLNFNNKFQVPKIEKIVINVGLGDAGANAKALESGVEELRQITGQQPKITRAKKSIAGFKVREQMPVGAQVTLRGERMYDFLAKLIGIVFPRIRDFRGFSEKGFDGRGNYNIGLKDQLVFPEIDYDKVFKIRGMNITLVTTAKDDMNGKALLTAFGFPFRRPKAVKVEQKQEEVAAATEE